MRTFDRIMIVALVLGVWALVLKPDVISAQVDWHQHDYASSGHSHSCHISGKARGWAEDGFVEVRKWDRVNVICFD